VYASQQETASLDLEAQTHVAVVHLLRHSTGVHGDVAAGVPDPDHQDPLTLQTLGAAVIPAVEVSAPKALDA